MTKYQNTYRHFTLVFFFLLLFVCAPNNTLKAEVYYVSSTSGDDLNDGLSMASPWKTLAKVNEQEFSPGDSLLFKSGDTWKGMLWLKGSGNQGKPIVVDKYGGEAKPLIDGDGYQASILIYNDDHYKIGNLELTNEANYLDEDGDSKIMDGFVGQINDWGSGRNVRFGLKIVCNNRSLNYFRITSMIFRDIYPSPTNLDNSHQGYGIKFESQSDQDSNNYHIISDVEVTDCLFTRTGHYGLWIKPLGKGIIDHKHKDYLVRNCTFSHTGGSGIVPNLVEGMLVEHCLFDNTGSSEDDRMWKRGSGIWPFRCTNVIIQENDFLHAHGPADSYGAHIDFGNTNVVMQYNFSFDNEGGFVEILGDNINCGYRYNISVNDGYRTGSQFSSVKGKVFWVSSYCGQSQNGCSNEGIFIYNNTAYVPNDFVPEIFVKENSGEVHLYNNLVFAQSGGEKIPSKLSNAGNTFFVDKNLFFPQSEFDLDTELQSNAIYFNPRLVAAGGISPEDYWLNEASPALKKGHLINGSDDKKDYLKNNGARDFFGNPVSNTQLPNIGAWNGDPAMVYNKDISNKPPSIIEVSIERDSNMLMIDYLMDDRVDVDIHLFDMGGHLLQDNRILLQSGVNHLELHSILKTGIYVVKVYIRDKIIVKKILLKD